mgnify:CR=1 FL=1
MTTLERRLEDLKDAARRFAKAGRENAPPDECTAAVRDLSLAATAWDKAEQDARRAG